MKKIVCILLVSLILTISLTGCKTKASDEVSSESIPKEIKIEKVEKDLTEMVGEYKIVSKGNYYFFSSKHSNVYVAFLDQLDETKYEIVDIKLVHFSDGNFFVTYKAK